MKTIKTEEMLKIWTMAISRGRELLKINWELQLFMNLDASQRRLSHLH